MSPNATIHKTNMIKSNGNAQNVYFTGGESAKVATILMPEIDIRKTRREFAWACASLR
jgi:hypothetical protein